jgi:hypothetical protein
MQLMLGVLKKKLKHDLKHDVEELDLPQATTASRILKDRSPDVTLLRDAPRAHSLALGELSHLSTVDSE